jgi:hypothetical protein
MKTLSDVQIFPTHQILCDLAIKMQSLVWSYKLSVFESQHSAQITIHKMVFLITQIKTIHIRKVPIQ